MIVHDPIGHVNFVAGLFHQVIAAQPAEQVPVADLVFHFAERRRLRRALAAAGHVEVGPQVQDLAHGAVANLLNARQVVALVATLQAGHHGEPLPSGFLVGGHQQAIAGRVDTTGLLQEDVFARLDRGRVVQGPEMRRRAQQDQVHPRFDDLLVGVEADETPLGRHVDPRPQVVVFPQVLRGFAPGDRQRGRPWPRAGPAPTCSGPRGRRRCPDCRSPQNQS